MECVGLRLDQLVMLSTDPGEAVAVVTVVLLLVAICDCISQPQCERIIVGTRDPQITEIAPIVLDALNLPNFFLEVVFKKHRNATEVRVDFKIKVRQFVLIA